MTASLPPTGSGAAAPLLPPKDRYILLRNGHFADVERGPFQLRDVFRTAAGADHLVVHFHGGLVPSEAILDHAARTLSATYDGPGRHPVFVVWSSDLGTVLKTRLAEIAREVFFKRLLDKVVRFAGGKLFESRTTKGLNLDVNFVERELFDAPEALDAELERLVGGLDASGADPDLSDAQLAQLEAEVSGDLALLNEFASVAAAQSDVAPESARAVAFGGQVTPATGPITRLSATGRDALFGRPDAVGTRSVGLFAIIRTLAKVIGTVVKRFVAGRDHGLYATAIEELGRLLWLDTIGGAVWDQMKATTADAFAAASHGGAAFVAALKDWWTDGRRVTLVGHSAGAVFISHLLEYAHSVLPAGRRFDVSLLAPAVTFHRLDDALRAAPGRVRSLSMFGLSDERERDGWLGPYHGSLLYLVSGMFEAQTDEPIVGMQRYWASPTYADPTSFPHVASLREVFGAQRPAVWAPHDGGDGARSDAGSHGDLDDDPGTLASVRHLLGEG